VVHIRATYGGLKKMSDQNLKKIETRKSINLSVEAYNELNAIKEIIPATHNEIVLYGIRAIQTELENGVKPEEVLLRAKKLWREFLKEKRKEKNRRRELDTTNQVKPTKLNNRGDING